MIVAEEKSASTRLTALPLADFGFSLRRVISAMPFIFGIAGHHPAFELHVFVVKLSSSSTLSPVHTGAIMAFATMRWGICSGKCWMISVLISALVVSSWPQRRTPARVEEWTSRPAGIGERAGMNAHLLMSGCFTPCASPPPLLSTPSLPLARARKASAVWRADLERGKRNIHPTGLLGNGRCWPGCQSIFEAAGRQVRIAEVRNLLIDVGLAYMPRVICIAALRHTLLARHKICEAGQQCTGASPAWLGRGRSSLGVNACQLVWHLPSPPLPSPPPPPLLMNSHKTYFTDHCIVLLP